MIPPRRQRHGHTDAYRRYMRSIAWKWRRYEFLKTKNFRCERCNSRDSVEVHHKTYERLGHERDADLEALCRMCHDEHHGSIGDGISRWARKVLARGKKRQAKALVGKAREET